jgi:uncharacterized protein (TIGR03435 family)
MLISVSFLFARENSGHSQVGQKAPEISLKKILNKPDGVNPKLEDLRGKIVILEFWATWCAPCIPAMEHLSRLQKKFEDDLQVIAISAEDEKRLRQYLKKKPTNLWIGIDSDNTTFEVYAPKEIPHSVIIDKNGVIAAITYPHEITESKIQKMLSGEPVSFKAKKRDETKGSDIGQDQVNEKTLFYVCIKPSESPHSYSHTYQEGEFKERRITAGKLTIPMLYQLAYQIPSPKRVIYNLKNPEQYKYENAEKYDFDLIVPQFKKEKLHEVMIFCLNNSFTLNAKIELKKTKVKVLKVESPGKLKISDGSETYFAFRGPNFEAKNIAIKKFAEYLENFTDVPIVDETMLNDKYDIKMEWQFEDPTTFYEALKALGLTLEDAERPVEHLVLSNQ